MVISLSSSNLKDVQKAKGFKQIDSNGVFFTFLNRGFMAKSSSFSHLLTLRRRFSLCSQNPKPPFSPIRRLFSTSPATYAASSTESPKPSSLSARMSFVFDQIDAIERERSDKDETLQRIRAWRQSKNNATPQNLQSQTQSRVVSSYPIESETSVELDGRSIEVDKRVARKKTEVELVHPWPEWIELMERLVHQNYFDHRRKNDDKMMEELGIEKTENVEADDCVRIDFSNFKTVQAACLNFGKDRFDILRSLPRQAIQVLVGYGCPSSDKKVVFSAKLLRKHGHLDEGDVCSSCSLRSSCERAYLVTNKEDEARTIDIMRVLLAYGFDLLQGPMNTSLLKQKSLKTVVRKLLHDVVKLSAVPIDPNLPPPVIKKAPPKVKQPPPPPRKRIGRDDVEMKKGDWLCPKCDFMNFAKNTECLQCDAKRPKRQLLPGEWECPECNFLNYRRNMACFHCECKRPADEYMDTTKMQEPRRGNKTGLEKIVNRADVSNAWNFDFDDDESDGADVASFEYADSSAKNYEDSPLISKGPVKDFTKSERNQRSDGREYPDATHNRSGTGFDDFDDEDDIDSYELDTQNSESVRRTSLSQVEGFSDSEDMEGSDNDKGPKTRSSSYNKPSHCSEDDEMSFNSDEDISVHPNWKSSHVANTSRRGGGSRGSYRGLTFGSDEESDLENDFRPKGRRRGGRSNTSYSGSEPEGHFPQENRPRMKSIESEGHVANTSRRGGGSRCPSGRLTFGSDEESNGENDFRPKRNWGEGHSSNFDSGLESEYHVPQKNRTGMKNIETGSRGKISKGHSDCNNSFVRDSNPRSNGMRGNRGSFSDDFDGSSIGSRSKYRGSGSKDYGARKMNSRGSDFQNSRETRREVFGNKQHRTSKEYGIDKGPTDFRNSRRVIER